MEVDPQADPLDYLQDRPGLKIPERTKAILKGRIEELSIEVTTGGVFVYLMNGMYTYGKDFVRHLTEYVAISTKQTDALGVNERFPEFVRQRYMPAALDFLRDLFDGFGEETVIDVFKVSIASAHQNPLDANDFQIDKGLFLATLKFQFHYMNKKLNVGHFAMTYSGDDEDEDEVLTFLRNMNLIGDKQLTFRSNKTGGSELCFSEVLELSQWYDAQKLVITWPMWTDMSIDNWLHHFPTTRICLWRLKVDTVKEIIEHANSTPEFNYCIIRTRASDWQAAVRPFINSNFDTVSPGRYIDPRTKLEVVMFKNTCQFKGEEMQRNGAIEEHRRVFGLRLLSIDVNPERAYFKVHNGEQGFEDVLTPILEGRCRFIRKDCGPDGQTTRNHELFDVDYIQKLCDTISFTLSQLEDDALIEEFHVALSWKDVDSEMFSQQRKTFIELMRAVMESRGSGKSTFLKVEKFVIEYSGSSEDEDNVMAFLPWMELTGNQELHFRPNRLSKEVRKLELTAGGVLSLQQWKRAKKFVMCEPFYLELSHWKHFPKSKVVVRWISRDDVEHVLQHFLASPTFISCVIETIDPEQNQEVLDLICERFPNHYPYQTEFSDPNGFQVVLVDNMYIFKAP